MDNRLRVIAAMWPTATVMSDGDATENRGVSLPRRARQAAEELWPTPDANAFADGMECTPEEWEERRQRLKESANNGNGCGTPLAMAAHLWMTPHGMAGVDATGKPGAGGEFAQQAVGAVETWGTPSARDHRDGGEPSSAPPTKGLLGRQVCRTDTSHSSRPAPATGRHGRRSSLKRRIFRLRCRGWIAWRSPPWLRRHLQMEAKRLNPAFVCWLMGFPAFWTHPGLTSSEQQAMESCLSAERMHCALSGLLWAEERSRARGLFDGMED